MPREFFYVLVTFSLISCGSEESRKSMVAVNSYAIEEARDLKRLLLAKQKCPSEIDNWTLDNSYRDIEFSTVKVIGDFHYPMRLFCMDDLKFNFVVKYGIGAGTWVTGGVNDPIQISYGHYTDLKHLIVTASANVREIAEKVVPEQ